MLPPSCVITLFLLAAPKNSENERLKKETSSAPFWQMPCPHDILDDSLDIRRLNHLPAGADQAFKSKKMGISSNINREPGSVQNLDQGFRVYRTTNHKGTKAQNLNS